MKQCPQLSQHYNSMHYAWHYAKAQKDEIKSAMGNIDWSTIFSGLDVDDMTQLFTAKCIDIFSQYIPNEIVTCDDRDPPWMTATLKSAIKRKHRVYNKYVKRGRKPDDWEYVRKVRNETSSKITRAKDEYFSNLGKKLSDPTNGIKSYWATLNKIINNKKFSNIPPLLENGVFVTNFQTKTNIFNDHFVEQCSLISNDSVLPNFVSRCHSSLSNVEITGEKILKIIRSLDPKKAHGWDNISINMIKLCDVVIVNPLYLIYKKCLDTGRFPISWKKGNVLPIHKKENRQLKKNYRPISLLPVCGKIFEKLIFDAIYEYFCENQLLTPSQSGFRPGDSTVNQLLSVTHKIYSAFEEFPSRETRAIFLDISKAFDKVWHDGLLFKLKCFGISDCLFTLIEDFLKNRQQRVVLNGKSSGWSSVTAGVPQGSVLGPLFFLVYINDLVDNISSDAKLFADDTSLFTVVYDVDFAADKLNRDLEVISNWAHQWKMQFNPDRNKQAIQVIFSQKKDAVIHPAVLFNGSEVAVKMEHKHLGMILDSKLNFYSHIREAIIKARRGIGIIRFSSKYVSRDVLDQIYKLYVRPHLDYSDIIYHKYDPEFKLDFTKKLESTQYSAALAVTGAWRGTNTDRLYEELGWEILYYRRWYRRLCHFYKLRNDQRPFYLYSEIPQERKHHYNLRRSNVYEPNVISTNRFSHTYFQNCMREWNLLDETIKNSPTISVFKGELVRLVIQSKKSYFGIHDIEGIRLLTRLRVHFSDLREHKFRHKFQCSSPMCLCQTGIENNEHYFLHCPRHSNYRKDLLDRISNVVDVDIGNLSSTDLCNLLLYGNSRLSFDTNRQIIELTITFIKSTERFKQI